MNKFWQWMDKKDYGRLIGDKAVIFFNGYKYGKPPTKQMIIGYMMEFAVEHKIGFTITTENFQRHLDKLYENINKLGGGSGRR
jgi:hypothetical protein